MNVELLYEGLKLGSAVSRQEADGLFVEFAEPLPVGTSLTLVDDRGLPRQLDVARVVETQPAGMWLKEGAVLAAAPPTPVPVVAPESPAAKAPSDLPLAEEAHPAPKDPGSEGGSRKGRRRSKTFIGR